MSYEIIHGKKFVRTTDNKYIPFILSGSSNCTMFCGGREILERNWGIYNKEICMKTKEEILNWVDEKLTGYKYELFKEGSKWIDGNLIHRWFENCINKANTIEEIFEENPYRYIECYVWQSHKTEYGKFNHLMRKAIKTEAELLEWLKEAEQFIEDNKDGEYNSYIHCGFDGIEPIRVNAKPNGKIIIKSRNMYLSKLSNCGYSMTHTKVEALIFDSVEAFKEAIKGTLIERCEYRIIKAC